MRARQQSGLKQAFADPELRKKISERTKAGMADPVVRQRINERTKAGIAARAAKRQSDLENLWDTCPKALKRRFLERVLKDAVAALL